jgi:hypothetical protein
MAPLPKATEIRLGLPSLRVNFKVSDQGIRSSIRTPELGN